jgi:hypothetical protein
MRSVGRFVLFTIVSSGTFTCLAGAEPSAPIVPTQELVDPWGEKPASGVDEEAAVVIDPWQQPSAPVPLFGGAPAPPAVDIVDPWQTPPPASPRLEIIELIDPWKEGTVHRVPTAAFPLVDPWRAR